jgi:hypothetical protein
LATPLADEVLGGTSIVLAACRRISDECEVPRVEKEEL